MLLLCRRQTSFFIHIYLTGSKMCHPVARSWLKPKLLIGITHLLWQCKRRFRYRGLIQGLVMKYIKLSIEGIRWWGRERTERQTRVQRGETEEGWHPFFIFIFFFFCNLMTPYPAWRLPGGILVFLQSLCVCVCVRTMVVNLLKSVISMTVNRVFPFCFSGYKACGPSSLLQLH